MKSWELDNVVETSIKYKGSFFIPDEVERNNQKINDEVRLHFILKNPAKNEPRAERMWVKITEISDKINHQYTGVLINNPVYIKDLKFNDIINFDANNIAQTIIKKDDPRWVDSFGQFAIVSKMCLENNRIIKFLYREKPDNKDDSGWRMFSGNEDDDYVNNPENIKMEEVGFLLDKDPSLLEPLKNGYGVAYERANKKAKWRKIDDWKPGK